MPSIIHYSNSIETLGEILSDSLKDATVFNPPTVIVPNPYLKKWIQMQIAKINGIAMHIDFEFLDTGIWNLLINNECNENKNYSLLQQSDIQLLLISLFKKLKPNNRNISSLSSYLYDNEDKQQTDFEKKLWQLTQRLSKLFIEYENHRPEMIKVWNMDKLIFNTDMEKAQQFLYKSLFTPGGIRDQYNENLLSLKQLWNKCRIESCKEMQKIHLFGISQISPLHAEIIYNLGLHYDITLFHLNPCKEYWEDITTPFEDRKNKNRDLLEEDETGEHLKVDENENYLLKLWGTPGRETIRLLSMIEEEGEKQERFISHWHIQDSNNTTALHTIQNHILNRSSDKNKIISQDDSIHIYSCPDIYREVLSVYNSICHNLETDEKLLMNDIAVMVPDMAKYAPVIHSVFSKSPRRISYSIIDSSATTESIFGNALISLLELTKGNFSRKELFKLILNPCFLHEAGLSANQAKSWLNVVHKLNIFHDFVDKSKETGLYTWHQGLQRLRLGRIMDPGDDLLNLDFFNLVPYSDLESNDPAFTGSLSYSIEQLYNQVYSLREKSYSGKEWAPIILTIISEFLAIPDDHPEEYTVFRNISETLSCLEILDTVEGNKFPIEYIIEFLKENLGDTQYSYGSYLSSGINISGLIPKRQIPFSIIYILGMEEGMFPGTGDLSTLNLISHMRKIGDISRPEANRYLFLENILSARKKLYITFVSKDLQRDQQFNVNSVVSQFISYLEHHILNAPFVITDIPFSSYSVSPETVNNLLEIGNNNLSDKKKKLYFPNYSRTDKILYQMMNPLGKKHTPEPLNENNLFPTEQLHDKIDQNHGINDILYLTLNDLRQFLLNPIESALLRHLQLYDEIDEDLLIDNEPFFSSSLFQYQLITESIDTYISKSGKETDTDYGASAYSYARLKGQTPEGAFSEIDQNNISDIIRKRIKGSESNKGISTFIEERKNCSYVNNIVFGEIPLHISPGHSYDFIGIEINDEQISISGLLKHLWKDRGGNNPETLILTTSNNYQYKHLISPFLFFILARSGLNRDLYNAIGNGPFTIHVSARSTFTSFIYDISEQEAKEYITMLLNDFSKDDTFDMLPFQIITDKMIIEYLTVTEPPSKGKIARFRNDLIYQIEQDLSNSRSQYRPLEILHLFRPRVPEDAFEIVARRLMPILNPEKG